MVPCPEQGADNGGRHRRRCRRRLGLQAPVDDNMGGTGELQRGEQQHRPWREDPLPSPHCVSRKRNKKGKGRFWMGEMVRRAGIGSGGFYREKLHVLARSTG